MPDKTDSITPPQLIDIPGVEYEARNAPHIDNDGVMNLGTVTVYVDDEDEGDEYLDEDEEEEEVRETHADQVFNPSQIRAAAPAENSKPEESDVSYGSNSQMVESNARPAIHPDATLDEAHDHGKQDEQSKSSNGEIPVLRTVEVEDSKIETIKGNCFPECSNTRITERLNKMIPSINIMKYSTGTFPELFERFIEGLKSSSRPKHATSISETEENILSDICSMLDPDEDFKIDFDLPYSIILLFESLPRHLDCIINLPITSTPLSINSQLDHGWKANQSIFDFIKKQLGNSGFSTLFGGFFGDLGNSILHYTEKATVLTENLMHIFGRDIQLGPYWSLGEGALDNRQSLTFNTVLVNDSEAHYAANAKIMQKLFIESQPYAVNDNQDLFKINPPSIFDIELDTCVAGKKTYYLCAGQFSCEAKGRYYTKEKIPEAYSLSLTFNSLIPDLLEIQKRKNEIFVEY